MKFMIPLALSSLFLFSACGQTTETKTAPPAKKVTTSEHSMSTNKKEKEINTTPEGVCSADAKDSGSCDGDKKAFSQTGEPEVGDTIATITTNKGTIVLRLFPKKAPKTVENFVGHSEEGYYDDVIFHRVIDGFMIQGGDPLGTGTGGESIWGGQFADEFDPELKNIPGSISMANAGPNTNGSQFFINQGDNEFLDGRHTVFGQVLEGMDTVNTIAKTKKDARDKPLDDVIIESITITKWK